MTSSPATRPLSPTILYLSRGYGMMQARRTGAYAGVFRLYDPRRRCLSVRLWFDKDRAERAARRAQAERQQQQLFTSDTDR